MLRIEHVNKVGLGVSRIVFASGEMVFIEWRQFARAGTVFERLADPDYSTKCRKAEGGYALRWPDGVDWSADAVYSAGKAAGALMVARDLQS